LTRRRCTATPTPNIPIVPGPSPDLTAILKRLDALEAVKPPVPSRPGEDGKDGTNGTDGKPGRGIVSVVLNVNKELIVTFSDGTTLNAGKIISVAGEPGKAGRDGQDGKPGGKGDKGEPGPARAIKVTLTDERDGTTRSVVVPHDKTTAIFPILSKQGR